MSDFSDEFDSFYDDDDDDFIALTAAPEEDLLTVKGENSVLRAKLAALELSAREEAKKLREAHNMESSSLNSKLRAYEDKLLGSEEQREILEAELRRKTIDENKNRKKRKIDSADVSHGEVPKESVSHEEAMANDPVLIVNQIVSPVELSLFIESMYAHVIPGFSMTTLTYLGKIISGVDFQSGKFRLSKESQSVKSAILDFMVQLDSRLDVLMEEFTTTLTMLIRALDDEDFLVGIPFLLGLCHFALLYRPPFVTDKTTSLLLDLLAHLLEKYSFCIKNNEDSMAQQMNFLSGTCDNTTFQTKCLTKCIVTYCFDLLETVADVLVSQEKDVWSTFPKAVLASAISSGASSNHAMSVVEVMILCFNDNVGENQDLLILAAKLLHHPPPLGSGLRIYGLNRALGSNADITLIEPLVGDNNPHALPLSEDYFNSVKGNASLREQLVDEIYRITLQERVLRLFEVVVRSSTLKLDFLVFLLSVTIELLATQQDIVMQNPRSESVYQRVKIMTIIVRIHYVVWKSETKPEGLTLSKLTENGGSSYQIFVTFARIASSESNLSEPALQLLEKARTANFVHPLFNSYIEKKSHAQNRLEGRMTVEGQCRAEANLSNGLEVPLEAQIIGMAREISEMFVTIQEADDLYYTMNCPKE